MGECKCDCGATLNSLKCVVYENGFAKNELCGRRRQQGCGWGLVGGRSKMCQERKESYLLLNVESRIRMCREPVPGNPNAIGGSVNLLGTHIMC